jgi:hypothetical protein
MLLRPEQERRETSQRRIAYGGSSLNAATGVSVEADNDDFKLFGIKTAVA